MGVILLISFSLFLIIRYRKRKAKPGVDRRAPQDQNLSDRKMPRSVFLEMDGDHEHVAEIDGQLLPAEAGGAPRFEMAGEVPVCEKADATSPILCELPGDEPGRPRNGAAQ